MTEDEGNELLKRWLDCNTLLRFKIKEEKDLKEKKEKEAKEKQEKEEKEEKEKEEKEKGLESIGLTVENQDSERRESIKPIPPTTSLFRYTPKTGPVKALTPSAPEPEPLPTRTLGLKCVLLSDCSEALRALTNKWERMEEGGDWKKVSIW